MHQAPETAEWVQVEQSKLSRLLYPNPVCLLTVRDAVSEKVHVMTITWLTAINNHAAFICSLNATRHTAQFVNKPGAIFVLSVPVRGMEELVLNIGGSSGAEMDKIQAFNVPLCRPGGPSMDLEPSAPRPKKQKQLERLQRIDQAREQGVAVASCVAHLLCQVDTVTLDESNHLLLRCTQVASWVRADYWNGKNFLPQDDSLPPFMTFLGTKVFGYVYGAKPSQPSPSTLPNDQGDQTDASS